MIFLPVPTEKSADSARSGVMLSRLEKLRRAAKLNQTQLAERVGSEQATISKLENGRTGASLDMIEALAEALGVTPGELFDPPARYRRVIDIIDSVPLERQAEVTRDTHPVTGPELTGPGNIPSSHF